MHLYKIRQVVSSRQLVYQLAVAGISQQARNTVKRFTQDSHVTCFRSDCYQYYNKIEVRLNSVRGENSGVASKIRLNCSRVPDRSLTAAVSLCSLTLSVIAALWGIQSGDFWSRSRSNCQLLPL